MHLALASPWGLLCLLGVFPALLAVTLVRRSQRRAATALGLPPESRRRSVGARAAVVGAVALVALAASEPVALSERRVETRTDAEVYVVVDTSLSMLARPEARARSRFDVARAVTRALPRRVPSDLPIGLAAMPQALLPMLVPTTDRSVFEQVASTTLRVGALPARPDLPFGAGSGSSRARAPYVATNLSALGSLALAPFFSARAAHRVAVLVTDGESAAFDRARLGRLLSRKRIRLVVVRVGSARDRLWRTVRGRRFLDVGYRPTVAREHALAELATAFGGHAPYRPDQLGAVAARVRSLVGTGPHMLEREVRLTESPLAPWLVLAASVLAAFALAPVVPPLTRGQPLGAIARAVAQLRKA